ncbi:bifunctional metallophosphatase/5'-nucleotidase [Synechocystis sp. LKSZ1]|uniref:bifunctional metallophosphatase/5'-nucleotidase n=1 Tax=Synechocystis sp. LKSZ1 TaxID=3144951 RepID=UPI00336BC3C7
MGWRMRDKGFGLRSLGLGILCWGLFATLTRAETIPFTLLHLNDVYEITPIENGQWGGLARVATVRQQLKAENPQTYTILAGDFLSPSALGTAIYQGNRLAGRHMVAVLNAMGLDYAAIGNHEFDLNRAEFEQRLRESQFSWIAGNVTNPDGQPIPGILSYQILNIPGAKGGTVRVGILGLTIASNPVDYVRYTPAITTARRQIAALKDQVDVWVAVTHLSLAEDRALAKAVPEIDLILGGHEHENIFYSYLQTKPQYSVTCPRNQTPILKADANARTVYIHELTYDTTTRCLQIRSRLQPITPVIADHPETAQVAQYWQTIGFQAFQAQDFDPQTVVIQSPLELDALDASVRTQTTNLTRLITRAMAQTVPDAQLVVFNGGMIRLDDRIPPGPITQYDIIRLLPFGGKIITADLSGALLQKIVAQGQKNQGMGGYLHWAGLDPQAIVPSKTYRVALMDYLLTGKEVGLGFLTRQTPGVQVVQTGQDIRQALIQYLQTQQDKAFANLDSP